MRPENGQRVTGVVETMHDDTSRYGGRYGLIRLDDCGDTLVWSSGNVYRNRTFMAVGKRVTCTVVDYSYASGISDEAFSVPLQRRS